MRTEALQTVMQLAKEWLDGLDERPVARPVPGDELRARLDVPLTGDGVDAETVVRDLAAAVAPGLVATPGPRYFGFVTGGSLPAALAADWLVSAYDQNAALSVMSPGVAAVEDVTASWVLELLGLPPDAAVGFVTGAQMANFSCLAAARHALYETAGWDVEADGLRGAPELTVLVGAQAHVTVLQALAMLGLGSGRAQLVPTDTHGRLQIDALRELLDRTDGPALVCAQAGEVNTGSVDPLREIAEATGRHGRAWLHVDGAFGLWAAASPSLRAQLDGVELADSWATDAHKWLNVPYDCGIAVVRRPATMSAALSLQGAAYLRSAGGREPSALTPEASRRARALPVYAALRSLGRQGLADLVERCCRLARLAAQELGKHPSVEILADVVLNQVLFRVRDVDTQELLSRIQQEGTCWLGGTVWQGDPALRFSVSNWSTTDDDIHRSVATIARSIDALRR